MADTFSYLTLGIINKVLMVQDDDQDMFLWFFITLASFSFLGVIITRLVSSDGEVKKLLIMLTYATNHHTVVDALEGVDGLADDELLV